MIKLIGVGSPQLNDDIGWDMIAACQQSPLLRQVLDQDNLEILTLDRPGPQLLTAMQAVDIVYLFDAVVSHQSELSSVIRLEDVAIYSQTGLLSTHGFGIAESIRLGEALQQLPKKIIFYGIVVDPEQALGVEKKAAAMDALVTELAAELTILDKDQ